MPLFLQIALNPHSLQVGVVFETLKVPLQACLPFQNDNSQRYYVRSKLIKFQQTYQDLLLI